ncbi:MAG: AAA-like domain-containing protein [Nodosilinea sp.]
MAPYRYWVGGSLSADAPTYIVRQADADLLSALAEGTFCYVFNSRQMGKSSLLFRTRRLLEQQGIRSAFLDMTRIGSETASLEQWYRGIVAELWRSFALTINLKAWRQEVADLSPLQQLSLFIETVLLPAFPDQRLVIFIDEIDSVLSLSFSVNDFFTLIRSCYTQRSVNRAYERLTFALFGVATPTNLMQDPQRTPFNIGQAIALHGFRPDEVEPLRQGLVDRVEDPDAVLKRVLAWTGGQPFLTQKLCQIVVESQTGQPLVDPDNGPGSAQVEVAAWIDRLVQSHSLQNWESQDNPEHLRTIRDRIERNAPWRAGLLAIYQQVLRADPAAALEDAPGDQIGHQPSGVARVKANDSREQVELILSGLVVLAQGYLQVRCPIYRHIFNLGWVEQQLAALRPYAEALKAWVASGQTDASRLLRGQSLQDALAWAEGKSLSNLDYRFLAASQTLEQDEARGRLEQRNLRQQNLILSVISLALLVSTGLGAASFAQYRQALTREHQLRISEIQAIAASAEALFASGQRLDALVQAIKAQTRLQSLLPPSPPPGGVASAPQAGSPTDEQALHQRVQLTLQQAVYGATEFNRISGFDSGVNSVAVSPDGAHIATASFDGKVKLWRSDGAPVWTLTAHENLAWGVAFSPDSSVLMSSGADGKIHLWSLQGHRLQTLEGHTLGVWQAQFSPDGALIASASPDQTVKLWRRNGTLLKTLPHDGLVFGLSFSGDGQFLATGAYDNQVRIWQIGSPAAPEFGTLLRTLSGHRTGVTSVGFRPTGNLIASTEQDGTTKLWRPDGRLVKTLDTDGGFSNLAFSPDGQTFASVDMNGMVKLWRYDGTPLASFRGHSGEIRGVAFSPDGQTILSSGLDGTVRFWRPGGISFLTILHHEAEVRGLAISPDGQRIVTGTSRGRVYLWNKSGALVRSLDAHGAQIQDVAYSFDGDTFATASWDGTIKLWRHNGDLVAVLNGATATPIPKRTVAFSPDGAYVVAGDFNGGNITIWRRQGQVLRTVPACASIVGGVVFSPDSQRIASGCNDNQVKLWNLAGEQVTALRGHQGIIRAVAFSADGQHLVSGSVDTTAKLWSTDGGLLATFVGHSAPLLSVAYTHQARYGNRLNQILIASASGDRTVNLWQPDGGLVATLNGHSEAVNKVVFSADGQQVISASADSTAVIWDINAAVDVENTLKLGCDWIKGYLYNNSEVPEGDRAICDAGLHRR